MKTNLKMERVNCRLTQLEVANHLNVSVQSVYLWEQGRQCVSKKHWPRLASLLHLSETELESALVETLLDACIAKQDARPLLNAQTSRLYNSELVADALSRFGGSSRYPVSPRPAESQSASEREMKLDYERQIFERDKRIFELEKQVEELRRELERRRPAASISSALSHNQSANAVEWTKQVEELSSEVNHERRKPS